MYTTCFSLYEAAFAVCLLGVLRGVVTFPKEAAPFFALKLSHITPTMTPAMVVPNHRVGRLHDIAGGVWLPAPG